MGNYTEIKIASQYANFFERLIKENSNFRKEYALTRNLSYNMQYLEYLSLRLRDDLHATIKMEFTKTFVITGMSIAESIFYYLIKARNLQRQNFFQLKAKVISNNKIVDGETLRIETTILKKLESPVEKEMSLDAMLKKVESKKLLGSDSQVYKELNHLRKLRNKIHLFAIEERLDTDWNNFGDREFELIKKALRAILYSEIFPENRAYKQKLFDFLE